MSVLHYTVLAFLISVFSNFEKKEPPFYNPSTKRFLCICKDGIFTITTRQTFSFLPPAALTSDQRAMHCAFRDNDSFFCICIVSFPWFRSRFSARKLALALANHPVVIRNSRERILLLHLSRFNHHALTPTAPPRGPPLYSLILILQINQIKKVYTKTNAPSPPPYLAVPTSSCMHCHRHLLSTNNHHHHYPGPTCLSVCAITVHLPSAVYHTHIDFNIILASAPSTITSIRAFGLAEMKGSVQYVAYLPSTLRYLRTDARTYNTYARTHAPSTPPAMHEQQSQGHLE